MRYIPNKKTEMIADSIQVKGEKNNFYTFPLSGNHTIYIIININNCTSLRGLFSGIKMSSITFTPEFNTENIEDMNSMFGNCNSLISINFSNLNTKNVKNMEAMFYDCNSLQSMDFSNLDLRNVEVMYKFCYFCNSLTLVNFTNTRTLNVTSYPGMFGYCWNLTSLELPNFEAKNIDTLFLNCPNLRYIDIHSINCQSNDWFGVAAGYDFFNNGRIKINGNCASITQNPFSNWTIIKN